MSRNFNSAVNDRVVITRSVLLEPTSSFTVSLWVKLASRDASFLYWLSKLLVTSDRASYGLHTSDEVGETRYTQSYNDVPTILSIDTSVVNVYNSSWHNLLGRFISGTGFEYWIDGIQRGSNTTRTDSPDYNTATNVWLGGFEGLSSLHILSLIAEFAFWSNDIGSTAIGNVAAGSSPMNIGNNPVCYVRLKDTALEDISGNGHAVNIFGDTGGPATSADHPSVSEPALISAGVCLPLGLLL